MIYPAVISPSGLDDSKIDYDELKEDIAYRVYDQPSLLHVTLADEQGRSSEAVGVIRTFSRRAALTKPVDLGSSLKDKGFVLSDATYEGLCALTRKIAAIEPPSSEVTTIHEGKYKKVAITRKVPWGYWWKHIFLDLYVENDSLKERLDPFDAKSKQVLEQADIWKRYQLAQQFIEKRKHFDERVDDEQHDLFEPRLEHRHIVRFLKYNGRRLNGFIRSKEDYQYVLLGFHHAGFDVEHIHGSIILCCREESELENRVREFNDKIRHLTIADLMKPPDRLGIFAGISIDSLNEAYIDVKGRLATMESPIAIPEELWKLGFLALKRNRKVQPSKASYALLKVKRRPSAGHQEDSDTFLNG